MGRRAAFDPMQHYIVARAFTWHGKQLEAGDPFNDRRDMRRFRQLYDSRFLRMSEVDSGAPNFKGMKVEELCQWLIDHGRPTLAHPKSTHFRLIERCQRRWIELQEHPDGVTTRHDDPEGSGAGVQGAPPPGVAAEGSVRQRERLW